MKEKTSSTLIVLFILFFSACSSAEDQQSTDQVLKVGIVPQFSSERINTIWEPILKAVTDKTGIQLQLDNSTDIPSFEKRFNAGEFDIAYMNPYHAIVAHTAAGYEPILRDVGRTLYGIIVVKKDSPLETIEDLDGKKVAFPAPNALGAALIPRTEFARKYNIKVEEIYVSSHSSVYLNVVLGLAQAGGGVQKTLQQQSKEIRSQLRIINKTVEVPPHPIVAHLRVAPEIVDKLTDAFLELGETVDGREMLGKIPIKVIGSTELQDYDLLREMGLEDFYVQ